jgi:hypothetical protein
VIAVMFGAFEQFSVWAIIAGAPIFIWELSLGLWLAIKGFKPSPITTGQIDADTPTGRHRNREHSNGNSRPYYAREFASR